MVLQVKDESQRPPARHMVESSLYTGLIFTGRNAVCSMGVAGSQGGLSQMVDFILYSGSNAEARDGIVKLLELRLHGNM